MVTHASRTAAPTTPAKARNKKLTNLLKRNGWFYFKKIIKRPNGQKERVFVSLETKDLELAKAKRDQLLRQLINDELAAIKGPRLNAVGTIGDIMETYRTKIHTVNESLEDSSVRGNLSALKSFLTWAHGEKGVKKEDLNIEAISAQIFADELWVGKFRQNYLAQAGDDREAREARRRGAASILRQVKSLFSKQAMLIYRELNLPNLDAFRAASSMETEDRVHRTITPSTMGEMWHAMVKLKTGAAVESPEAQLWLVHNLTKFLGLRNDEIKHARVEWFKRAPWGQIFFSVLRTPYFEPKRSQGHIPLTAEVAQLFAPFCEGKQPGDFLVTAKHVTEREILVDKTHADWMRQFLPAGEFAKAGYELRRWAAQTIEARYGAEAGKAFLRHVPQGVAERHYFEHWFPWRRLGNDVGITLEEAMGGKLDATPEAWTEGAGVFAQKKVALATD